MDDQKTPEWEVHSIVNEVLLLVSDMHAKMTEMHSLLNEYKPLLEKYNRASQANGWREQRKALRS